MEIVRKPKVMQEIAKNLKKEGKTIGFVPTMGYFHEGHLSLMRKAKEENDITIISIFVNPTQFGPGEDYERYPRDFERDKKLAQEIGVDYIFYPEVKDIYPEGFNTYVEPGDLANVMCGAFRPGHFKGVATIVLKLFNLTMPDRAYFGKKDYQQLIIIRRMVKDLNVPVEIVGLPTVREKDGLAMSSRNVYLSKEERESALSLYKSLILAQRLIDEGERNPIKIEEKMRSFILSHPHVKKIDYIAIVDRDTLRTKERIDSNTLIALAVHVGNARLIDNMEVKIK